jgi:hypothetical protein
MSDRRVELQVSESTLGSGARVGDDDSEARASERETVTVAAAAAGRNQALTQ